MNLDFNKKDLSNNNKLNDFSKFVNNFIKELSNSIENYKKNKDLTYYVSINDKIKKEVYITARTRNGSGAVTFCNLSDLPKGTTEGTILRMKHGKFVIDKKLTEHSMQSKIEVEEANKKLRAEYKTENVDYLVKELGDDYVWLQNQKTGLEFDSIDFTQEVFDSLYEGLLLTCKNGEYVIKNIEN